MTVVPFLIVGATAGSLSLLLRHTRAASTAIAIAGLVVMAAAAVAMGPTASADVGGARFAGSDWLRLYAILGSLAGLLLVLVDVAALHEPDAPGAIVLGLTAAVVALAAADPGIAVIAATAGALGAVVVAAPPGRSPERAVEVGGRELRALAVAGTLAIVATAWVARPADGLVVDPAWFGAAYLAFAVAVAIRFGAIPFHLWAARVADAAPGVALPLLMAWGPAAFGAIAIAWIGAAVAPLALPLPAERAVVVAIGALSVVLGLFAAAIQDDLEHVVGYTIVADAGFVVLALGVLDPAVWEPARTWLLVFVVVRSALAAWVVAVHGAFGTRRIADLAGWARRAPVLAVALGVVAVAAVGWPGLAAWDARAAIAKLALPGPFSVLLTIAPVLGLIVYARIALVGIEPVRGAVDAGRGERPGWPAPPEARPILGRGSIERAVERLERAGSRAVDLLWAVPAAARWNRVPLASIAVLVLAALGLTTAGGGFGVAAAAREVPASVVSQAGGAGGAGTPAGPGGSSPGGEPAGASAEPGRGGGAGVSFEPIGSPGIGPSGAPPSDVPAGSSDLPAASADGAGERSVEP